MSHTTLITGASSGIGEALAHICAHQQHHLILVARRKDRLNQLKETLQAQHGIAVDVFDVDLADSGAVDLLFEAIKIKGYQVDHLINNAGFGDHGAYVRQSWSTEQDMIQVNVLSLARLTRLCLGPMIANGAGRIMNVASTAAFQPGPYMAVYYATKAYVLHYSEALAEELNGSGVTVTALCPGPTRSEFHQRANLQNSVLFHSIPIPSSAEVAAYGYRAMMKGQRVAIYGWSNKVVVFLTRFVPRFLVTKAVKQIQNIKARTT
jgi:short-subunit dehydrogenase